ncbi:MAG: amidohydrolase family protein [Acidimicrobiia bacterium]
MPYIADRLVHDADAHIMEESDWLVAAADPAWRDRMPMVFDDPPESGGRQEGEVDRYRRRHADPAYRADDAGQIMLRKNFAATGSFLAEDRPLAVDLIGVQSQLIFNTFTNGPLVAAEHTDAPLAEAMARAHNRAIVEFCSVDPRLLPVCYVPLARFAESAAVATEAVELGAAAIMVPSACPADHSPSHVGLDPVWAIAQDAGVPIVFHVGGGGKLLSPRYFDNGLPPVPDFHGGAENFRSVDYMAIPYWPMQTLATMIFDGVLDRFPRLKFGVIEQGGAWLPGFMRNLDAAFGAFRKNEERLHRLSAPPSEIVRRQVKVTPYPHEDTGWIIEQSGPELCLFSSDYPHVEGGRNPLSRFDTSLARLGTSDIDRFYFDNFVELMGDVLVRRGLPTTRPHVAA